MSLSAAAAVERLREVDRRLRRSYRPTRLGNPVDPLDELVFVLLSAQTEEYNYRRTYRALRRRYQTWDQALDAGEEGIYRAIRIGGLGRKKARQIVALLGALRHRFGSPGLPDLTRLRDDEVERLLTALPGVGLKTSRCVLMYSLGRAAFPVDTHVWRVMGRLGLATSDRAKPTLRDQQALQDLVPGDLRSRLHVNLVLHGRRVCTTAAPRCASCPLAEICPSRDLFALAT